MSILEKVRNNADLSHSDLIDFIYGSKSRYKSIIWFSEQIKSRITEDEFLKYYELNRVDKMKFAMS